MPKLRVGDKIKHRNVPERTGTITHLLASGHYRIRWDHPGLAYIQLGIASDIQNDDSVEANGA